MFSRGGSGQTAGDRMLPVFVFPSSLTFYSDDKSQHKQVLTVYNPYDFGVRFKVLCTAPEKYTMADAEGVIRSLCCIDLVIRHNAINSAAIGITDKFRISMYEHGQKNILGKKDIPVTLLKTAPPDGGSGSQNQLDQEKFQPLLPNKATHLSRGEQYSIATPRQGRDSNKSVLITTMFAVFCGLILMLPMQNDENSQFSYFQPTFNLKLVSAFFLGILVTLFIKS